MYTARFWRNIFCCPTVSSFLKCAYLIDKFCCYIIQNIATACDMRFDARFMHFFLHFHFQGTLAETLREAQPTIFFGVPRIYEKMMERIEERSEQIKGLKRRLSNWARKKGLKGNLRRQNRYVQGLCWCLKTCRST